MGYSVRSYMLIILLEVICHADRNCVLVDVLMIFSWLFSNRLFCWSFC